MSDANLRHRLAEHAVGGRFQLFVAGGALLALAGAALMAWAISAGNADRAWQLFHVNWLYFTGLAGGSVAIAAVHKIANARWSGLVLRFAEAAVAFFPVSLVGLVLIFTLGYDHIYGPMQEQLHTLSHGKALWLSRPWMFGRLFVGLSALFALGWRLVRADMLPDLADARERAEGGRRRRFDAMLAGFDASEAGREAHESRIHRLAPIYAVTYSMVFTLVAFDGIMALQPHWFSNLLGGFYFMGSFLGAHMLLALMVMYAGHQTGVWHLISGKQRHDLGKLCFGFTVFWAYLMYAQFLVIWYGNLPEETGFVFARLWGSWLPVGRAVFVGMFLVPFLGLLGVAPKKFPGTMALFASISLTALWLERYLLVMPSITGLDGPAFGLPELAPTLLVTGLFFLCYGLFARAFPMVSPRLAELTISAERHHAVEDHYDHDERAGDFLGDADVAKV
jgi:hypothetical protein